MDFASAFAAIVEAGFVATGRRFGSALNAEWVDEALQQTGTMSVRRRRLPARLVVWLVVAMALAEIAGMGWPACRARRVAVRADAGNAANAEQQGNDANVARPPSARASSPAVAGMRTGWPR